MSPICEINHNVDIWGRVWFTVLSQLILILKAHKGPAQTSKDFVSNSLVKQKEMGKEKIYGPM